VPEHQLFLQNPEPTAKEAAKVLDNPDLRPPERRVRRDAALENRHNIHIVLAQ
jgi:hypothetical protein